MSVCPRMKGHAALGRDVCCKWFSKRSKTHSVESQCQQSMTMSRGRRVNPTEGQRGQAGVGEQPGLSFSFIPQAAGGREGGLWPSLGLERSLLAACVGRPGG